MNRMGDIVGTPRNKRERKRIAKHMEEMTDHADYSFYLQDGFGASEFLEDCTPVQCKDLEHGWTISINADPWTFAHYFGYDCHTLYE
jgi:hypothetical protein